ncbi:trigger factor [Candidatus Margulisiibacteriota bacterium]
MKINKFEKKNYTITIELEEDYSVVDSFMDESFKELAKEAAVPGFRKGKVTRDVFEKNYGKGPILEKAVNKAMNKTYIAALEEKKVMPVDYPKNIEVKKLEEGKLFIFSLDVDVKPEVKLGKYKGLKIEKKEIVISDAEVQKQLDQLQENYAEYVLIEDRAAKLEDMISYDIKAFIADQPYEKWTKNNSGSKLGSKHISEDFDKAIVGMKAGETKEFEIEIKKDHFDKEVAGKKVKLNVHLHEIREKKLPELNEELVKKVGPFKTVEELRKDLKDKMQKHADGQNKNQFKDNLLKEVIKNAEVELPPAMVEREIDRMIQNLEYSIAQSKMGMEDYLKMVGKDMKSIREEFKDRAEDRVRVDLALEAIAEKESIEITEKDLDAELTKIAQGIQGQSIEESKQKVSDATRDYVKSYLKDEKTIDFLENHAKIIKK